jgi:hypothetical protein
MAMHVLRTTCTGHYMYWEIHALGTTCIGHYMYWALHVLGTTCIGHYMYWALHVLGNTCIGHYMYWALHVLGTTCIGHYMYWTLHVLDTTCVKQQLPAFPTPSPISVIFHTLSHLPKTSWWDDNVIIFARKESDVRAALFTSIRSVWSLLWRHAWHVGTYMTTFRGKMLPASSV